jgi:putative membrane-bound dehydrogenase-like protein
MRRRPVSSLIPLVCLFCLGCLWPARPAEPTADPSELPRIPPHEPEAALSTFRIHPGFHLETAAAEPLVVDPIALSFDENGRLYVVEMRGYSERRDDKLGRIRLIEDTDGDGRFDKSTVFAAGLAWPTAVVCYDGGVFVGVTPDILFLKDHDGDGVADETRVVFTGFARHVTRLNVQALFNSFRWGLDHRIHGATSFSGGTVVAAGRPDARPLELRGRDFSFDPRTLEMRAESGGGQHGLSFDDAGRKFVCSNSRHIQQIMYEDRYAARNPDYAMPPAALDIAADGPAAEVFRISQDEPWRIVRTRWRVGGLVTGPVEGGGRVSGYFTAATGVTIYRGNAWPADYRGDAFIGDAGSNLIHHKKFRPDGLSLLGERPPDERTNEFLASTDNWFRPVQFANAPDGCLYVADMYREVIEHPWSLPEPIKKYLDLNSGNDRGRVYRIAPDGFKQPARPRLGQATTAELVRTLDHPNGWHRDTAGRLLFERRDRSAAPLLETLFDESRQAETRVQALYALDGLGALESSMVERALDDPDARVRVQAVRLAESAVRRQSSRNGPLWRRLLSLARDPNQAVRYQLAFTLGEFAGPDQLEALAELAQTDAGNAWMQAAILSSLGPNPAPASSETAQGGQPKNGSGLKATPAVELLVRLLKGSQLRTTSAGRDFLGDLSGLIGAQHSPAGLSQWLDLVGSERDFALLVSLLSGLDGGLRRAGSSLARAHVLSRLEALFQRAVQAIKDSTRPEGERLDAIRLVSLEAREESAPVLLGVLKSDQPAPVREAALATLVRLPGTQAGDLLLQAWTGLPPAMRSKALTGLLSRPESARLVLAAMGDGTLETNALTFNQIESLRSHRNRGIRDRAVRLFGKPTPTETDPRAYLDALKLNGDAAKGEKTYLDRCATCHRAGRQGHALGPDFATVKTAGKEKILGNILEPSREVAPNYVQYDVTTRDGETLSGIIAGETATSLTVRQANDLETVVFRSQVAGMTSRGQSPMPEGLVHGLSPQDVADLLEFIVAQGN